MNLTVIVPYWNGESGIDRLINSLPPTLPIVIVDDHSDAPLQRDSLPTDREITVLRPPTKGYFTGAVNAGLQATTTDVLILNQDSWLEGAAALDTLNEFRANYAVIGERIKGDHPAWPDGYIHGTFMFIRRDAINTVGLMDAVHFPLWGSTADYQCRLARQGFSAKALPTVPGFVHQERTTRFGEAITEMLVRQPELKSTFIRTPPLISVVITCYNYGKYLADAVNSLIGGPTFIGQVPPQTFQGFEVVIVDDGSSDNSYALAMALAHPAKGIRVIKRKNGGTAAATNTGIQAAKGKYIAILAGDDLMAPDRLERMLTTIEANPHSFVYDDMEVLMTEGRRAKWAMQDFNFELLLQKNHVHAGIMFPKKAWEEVGGYPEIMRDGREDWAFNIALGSKGWCGIHLNYAGYLYRRVGQNRTLRNAGPEWREYFIDKLRGLYPALYLGERDKMCCGHDANSNYSNGGGGSNPQALAQSLAGSVGMPILEYQGANAGESSWWGKVTGTQYRFGGSRPRGRVDARDVPGFLELYKGKTALFVVIPEIVAKQETIPTSVIEELEPIVVEAQNLAPVSEPEPVVVFATEPEPVVAEGLIEVEAQNLAPVSEPEPVVVFATEPEPVVAEGLIEVEAQNLASPIPTPTKRPRKSKLW